MKKISIIVLILSLFVLAGCESTNNKVMSNGKRVDTSKMQHKHCTRQATATDAEVSLNYDLYYTGEKLNILKSEEKIISSTSSVLDTYQEAYEGINEHYKGLEYYDAKVKRENDSVTNYITINYDEINIDKLIAIEGEEDNVFENKVPKVKKWLDLAKKFGTKCELVED